MATTIVREPAFWKILNEILNFVVYKVAVVMTRLCLRGSGLFHYHSVVESRVKLLSWWQVMRMTFVWSRVGPYYMRLWWISLDGCKRYPFLQSALELVVVLRYSLPELNFKMATSGSYWFMSRWLFLGIPSRSVDFHDCHLIILLVQ